MFDVTALGTLYIRFIPLGNRSFQAQPSGACAHTLAAITNLGYATTFLGMVGQDDFGRMLQADLTHVGIDTDGLRFTQEANTTMAFMQVNSADTVATFVRKPGADMLCTPADVDFARIVRSKIFLFDSAMMAGGNSNDAVLKAAAFAKEKGITVCFSPSFNPAMWPSLDFAKKIIPQGFKQADIVKVSQEELLLLTGEEHMQAGAAQLHTLGVSLVFVTMGRRGCFYSSPKFSGQLPAYNLPVIDTTAAGDAFIGGVLAYLLDTQKPLDKLLDKEELMHIASFGNALGALATTKRGGMFAMPQRAQVDHCIKSAPKLVLPAGHQVSAD